MKKAETMVDKNQRLMRSYLDTIKAKTGKTIEDFQALAAEKGLTTSKEIVAWLGSKYGLGYQHAGAVNYHLFHADDLTANTEERLGKLFAGNKAKWRPLYDALAAQISEFGADVELLPNLTYVNVARGSKKFAILQASTAARFDIGIKRKGIAPTARFEAAGAWNPMVTHRVRIDNPAQVDADLLAWLKQAYAAAQWAKQSR